MGQTKPITLTQSMGNFGPSPSRTAKFAEESSNDEFKQLLSSLPKHKGFTFNHLYQFHGFWYGAHHLQSLINCQSHFSALDSDILLVTSPKSGTTWLKALVFALVNRPVFDSLTTRNPHDLVPYLDIKLYKGENRAPDLSNIPSPRLFATHMPNSALPNSVRDAKCRIVYLCRDPRDVLVSLWHFANKVKDPKDEDLPLEEVFETFCKGGTAFGPFSDHVLGYWKESVEMPSKVLFLKYEDVKGDTSSCLSRLAEFLGCPFSEDEEKEGMVGRIVELCSFDCLSNLEVNKSGKISFSGIETSSFFRRGQVGDWRNYLTPEMSLKLDNLVKEKLDNLF